MSKNAAYVFVKPHAHTEATVALVKKKFDEVGITILKEEVIGGEDRLDKLIDQHYYAIVEGDDHEAGRPAGAEGEV